MTGANADAVTVFWRQACADLDIDPATGPKSFRFGDSPALATSLARLVAEGPKRATAGLVVEAEADGEEPPAEGSHWVVLDGDGAPVVVIRSQQVTIAPFRTVDEGFAWDEGEGDRSLHRWRDQHVRYFQRRCADLGIAWSEGLDTVFERFDVVWPRALADRLILRRPSTEDEWAAYHTLRRTELFGGYRPSVRYDPDHPESWLNGVFHFGAFRGGALLGCLQVRLHPGSDSTFHLVAVRPDRRGEGVGRFLTAEGERFARVNGRRVVRAFAEPDALGFFRQLGFVDGPGWGAAPANPAAVTLQKRL
ncbi:MAG: GNAT family N-acetyltransferase [Inquilinaceae bacterium]